MRKVLVSVALAAASVLAAPKPVPAPKSITTPSATIPAPKSAPVIITPYGMVQYRLRYETVDTIPETGKTISSNTYSNTIGYKVGVKAQVNKEVFLQLEVGNDWNGTETVNDLANNYFKKRDPYTPWFSLAYAQWDPGYLHIQAGIVPVKGTATYDLFGASILNDRKYASAAHVPWGTITNSGMPGLRMGTPVLKGEFKLGFDFMTTVLNQRSMKAAYYSEIKSNHSAIGYMFDFPMSVEDLTLTPQLIIISDRNYNSQTGEGDPEILGGIDVGYKLSKQATFRLGAGLASNGNKNSKPDSVYERIGSNGNIGTTIICGPGKLDLDYYLSTDENTKINNSRNYYQLIDVKYGWVANKYFTITPRLRYFINTNEANKKWNNAIRPELIFAGSF